MKQFQNIVFLFLIMFLNVQCHSQEKEPEFAPYTIETTYQKLKKHYPFIISIQPIVSHKIKSLENVVYKTIGNKQLEADVYIPIEKSIKTYPAVLLIHGGGWLTGSKENQRVMAQHLALNGYVAITASYQLGLDAPYPAAVNDLKDAIRWMRKNAEKYHINPDKIAALGASAGGQLVTLIGVTPNSSIYGFDKEISDEVQAIINIDGIVSFIHPEASSEGQMASIWLNGSKEENFKNWKEASPLEYLNTFSPPTLFINSSQPRFHAGRDDMITVLNKYAIYNEQHTIPESPHSFWLMNPWFETTLNQTVDFLNQVLK